VISEVPPLLEVDNYRRAAIGYLKASPLGDKLLIAHNTTNFDQSETQNAGDCPLISIAQVTFNKSPEYNDTELIACKDVQEDFATFDLTEIKTILANDVQVNPNEINLNFYKSFEDAELENNPIPTSPSFINTEGLESLFAIVITFGIYTSIVKVELTIQEFPYVNLDDELVIYCLEDFPNPIVLDALKGDENSSNYQFLWSTGETSPFLEINSSGEYSVNIRFVGEDCPVTKIFNVEESQPTFNSETINLCDTYQYTLEMNEFNQAGLYRVEIKEPNYNCSVFKTIEVTESNIADFEVNLEDSSRDNKSIEITLNPSSLSIYEYALNEPINFQECNRFENLNPSEYIVYVRDQLGRGVSQKTVSVLGIMEFFTPNGDGINDIWKISGISGTNQENIQMEVYDRYGKLLASFTNQDRG